MGSQRYIKVPVIAHENKIYRYDEVEYVKDDYYGAHYKILDSSDMVNEFIELVYDLKKKKFVEPVSVEIFPESSYKIGDVIYRETNPHNLIKDKLVDIKFEEYKSEYIKFSKLESYKKDKIPEEIKATLIPSSVVEFRNYESSYVFESGFVTTYDYMFYKIEE